MYSSSTTNAKEHTLGSLASLTFFFDSQIQVLAYFQQSKEKKNSKLPPRENKKKRLNQTTIILEIVTCRELEKEKEKDRLSSIST